MDLIIETYQGGDTLFHVDKKGLYESFIFFASPCPEAGVIKCSGILSCEHSVANGGGGGAAPPYPRCFKPRKLASKYRSVLFRNPSCDHCVWGRV